MGHNAVPLVVSFFIWCRDVVVHHMFVLFIHVKYLLRSNQFFLFVRRSRAGRSSSRDRKHHRSRSRSGSRDRRRRDRDRDRARHRDR